MDNKETPYTDRDDRPYPLPEYAQHVRFEGCDCVVMFPEEYEALYEQSRALERERDELRNALSHTRIASTNAMNEIRAAADAPQSQDDASQKRAVDYVLELKQQLTLAQEDIKRLDWLENPLNQQWLYGTFVQGGSPRAVRVAIDAARNK